MLRAKSLSVPGGPRVPQITRRLLSVLVVHTCTKAIQQQMQSEINESAAELVGHWTSG